jgi:nitrous oxidase accessory protein
VTRRIVLRGRAGAMVDGRGRGSVVEVTAGGAVVQDLAVRSSGRDVMNVDAGIRVLGADDVVVRRVAARDVLYGVDGERSARLTVAECDLQGRVAPGDETGEGNGIHLWNSADARLTGNQVRRFLDAVYLSFATGALVERNRLEWNGRYGLHTMYCQVNRLIANRFAHNVAGCAIMFSNELVVERNAFVHNRGSRTYGLLLRDCSGGTFRDNRLTDNTVAVFMDNSNRNTFRGNLVQDNGWGVLLFASCAKNTFAANSFVHNDHPVALDMRRTNNRFDDGAAGNYWSDHAAYDLDADGVSDVPYSPVSAFAFVSKQYPDLTVLARSPAVAALDVAERVFPSLRPSDAVDRFPRVTPAPVSVGDGSRDAGDPPRRSWPLAAGFVALSAAGVIGLRPRRSAR